jgi:hypothetical protein
LRSRSKHLVKVLPDSCLEVKEVAATAAVEGPPGVCAYADARRANRREQDAASGSPPTDRREHLRGLRASLARAQQSASAGAEIGPAGPRPGDFPQAFTHLGLTSAAGNLDHQLG